MKMCFGLVYLLVLTTVLAETAAAQAGSPKAQIVTLNLDPQNITILHLRRGFVSSVRLPEEVSSVVLGDPGAFKAEHSEAEPQLVFFKPTTPKPSETNALITTRSGYEVSLSLVSEGNSGHSEAVDYVLKYERPQSFLIEAAHRNCVIGETKSLAQESPLPSDAQGRASAEEQELLPRSIGA
jgi:type IV secretory pathway VirB9-like protein